MDSYKSFLFAYQLLTFFLFSLGTEHIVPLDKASQFSPCSTHFCPSGNQEINPSCNRTWNSCSCSLKNIKCPDFTSETLTYEWRKIDNLPIINITYKTTVPLKEILQHFGDLVLNSTFNAGLFMSNEDCKNIKEKNHKEIQLNLNNFSRNSYILNLDLKQNCLSYIKGSFGTFFPKLTSLVLSENFLEQLDLRIFTELKKLENLIIAFNPLVNISRLLFQDLESLNNLSICNNNLSSLPEDLLYDLLNLRSLSICGNRNLINIPSGLLSRNKKLKFLDLDGNSIQQVSEDLFTGLNHLETLKLYDNKLISINNISFPQLHSLRYVYVRTNKLTEVKCDLFVKNKYISQIDLSYNDIRDFPELLLNASSRVKVMFRHCPVKESPLPLSLNQKEVSFKTCISKCQKDSEKSSKPYEECYIKYVSYNTTQRIENYLKFDEEYKFFLDSEIRIAIRPFQHKSEIFDCKLESLSKFLSLNNATKRNLLFQFILDKVDCNSQHVEQKSHDCLKISDVICFLRNVCPPKCRCDFISKGETVIIDCQEAKLKFFPDLSDIQYDLILHLEKNRISNLPPKNSVVWKKIKELYMEKNELNSLDNLTITNEMKKIYVNKNNITRVTDDLVDILLYYGQIELKLADNPWNCCSLAYVRKLILDQKPRILDADELKCFAQKSKETYQVLFSNASDKEFCITEEFSQSLSQSGLSIIISMSIVTIFGVIICLTLGLVRCYKSEILHWMFYHNLCTKLVTEEEIDSKKKYDAFVSYSYQDEEWVATVLVPGLEKETPSYKLCLHQRDWLGGEWITDQIVKSVEDSRRTIIVLSDSFAESSWGKLEFVAAYQQMVKDNVKRIIIVVPFDVPDMNRLDKDLRTFVTMNTYIKFGDQHFWRKLRCSMPRIRKPAKINSEKIIEENYLYT